MRPKNRWMDCVMCDKKDKRASDSVIVARRNGGQQRVGPTEGTKIKIMMYRRFLMNNNMSNRLGKMDGVKDEVEMKEVNAKMTTDVFRLTL